MYNIDVQVHSHIDVVYAKKEAPLKSSEALFLRQISCPRIVFILPIFVDALPKNGSVSV